MRAITIGVTACAGTSSFGATDLAGSRVKPLLGTFAYVANNPVEAGLCESPADWPWSSYAATVGLGELPTFVDPARVLACFDWPNVDPRAALRARVEQS
jgi:hypothetical protein